jgi:hypothetical protein
MLVPVTNRTVLSNPASRSDCAITSASLRLNSYSGTPRALSAPGEAAVWPNCRCRCPAALQSPQRAPAAKPCRQASQRLRHHDTRAPWPAVRKSHFQYYDTSRARRGRQELPATDSRMGFSYVKPRCGPRCRSVQRNGYFASHLRGEYALDRSWTRVSVSVQSAGPPSGCRRAVCGNRELVPLCRVIHARYRSRQRRSQETSVRALHRVAHQDGLARVKTTYVFCVR